MKALISALQALYHPNLPGVTVFPVSGSPVVGQAQEVIVCVEPNGMIPLHKHETDARMTIVAGGGNVLSEEPQVNGVSVTRGDCVFFEARKAHGFRAGPGGLSFLSQNGGIVSAAGNWDMRFA